MATKTKMATQTLTASQQAAQEFIKHTAQNLSPAVYITFSLAELMQKYDIKTEFNMIETEFNKNLTGLGYETSLNDVVDQYEATINQLEYWSGTYYLIDSDNNTYSLTVGGPSAFIILPNALDDWSQPDLTQDQFDSKTTLTTFAYENAVLTVSNDQMQFTLQFHLPYSLRSLLDGTATQQQSLQANSPLCSGTVQITAADGSSRTLTVRGKWQANTLQGLNSGESGDPAETWAGRYTVIDVTDPSHNVFMPDLLDLTLDPDTGLSFSWGDIYGTNARFYNNGLSCFDELDDTVCYVGSFSADLAGNRSFCFTRRSAFDQKTYLANWVQPALPASPHSLKGQRAVARLAAPMALQGAGPVMATVTLDWETGKSSTIDQRAVVGRGYQLTLTLNNLPTDVTVKEIVIDSTAFVSSFSVSVNDDKKGGTAKIELVKGADLMAAPTMFNGGTPAQQDVVFKVTTSKDEDPKKFQCAVPIIPPKYDHLLKFDWATVKIDKDTPVIISLPVASTCTMYMADVDWTKRMDTGVVQTTLPGELQGGTWAINSAGSGTATARAFLIKGDDNGLSLYVISLQAADLTRGSATIDLTCTSTKSTSVYKIQLVIPVVTPVSFVGNPVLAGGALNAGTTNINITIGTTGGSGAFYYELSDSSVLPAGLRLEGNQIKGDLAADATPQPYPVAVDIYDLQYIADKVTVSLTISVQAQTLGEMRTQGISSTASAMAGGITASIAFLMFMVGGVIKFRDWLNNPTTGQQKDLDDAKEMVKDTLKLLKDQSFPNINDIVSDIFQEDRIFMKDGGDSIKDLGTLSKTLLRELVLANSELKDLETRVENAGSLYDTWSKRAEGLNVQNGEDQYAERFIPESEMRTIEPTFKGMGSVANITEIKGAIAKQLRTEGTLKVVNLNVAIANQRTRLETHIESERFTTKVRNGIAALAEMIGVK